MWVYQQSTGRLTKSTKLVAVGYAGHGAGKNNPAKECVRGVGPLPRGRYQIVGTPYDSKKVGPYALRLEPIDIKMGDDTDERTGRGAFRIHGDSVKAPGTASNGCIVLPRNIREMIWKSGDRVIEVIA